MKKIKCRILGTFLIMIGSIGFVYLFSLLITNFYKKSIVFPLGLLLGFFLFVAYLGIYCFIITSPNFPKTFKKGGHGK